jgi:hypothetical protein
MLRPLVPRYGVTGQVMGAPLRSSDAYSVAMKAAAWSRMHAQRNAGWVSGMAAMATSGVCLDKARHIE